jgi:hypothetical protein
MLCLGALVTRGVKSSVHQTINFLPNCILSMTGVVLEIDLIDKNATSRATTLSLTYGQKSAQIRLTHPFTAEQEDELT